MSRLPETSQTPEYLDPREAAEWFPYTFYFSQGNETLHHLLFHYLKRKRPNQKWDMEFEYEIKKQAGPEIARLALSQDHQSIDKSDLPTTMDNELQDWRDAFSTGKVRWGFRGSTQEEFLDYLLRTIVARDYEWYFTKKSDNKERKPGPLNDKVTARE